MSNRRSFLFFLPLGAAVVMAAPPRRHDLRLGLPAVFQANQGQMPADVKYFARSQGYTLALSEREARLAPADGTGDVIIAFPSGNARIGAEDPAPFRINSILGSDPRRWVRNAPAWSRIRYREIQPGVDLVFHPSAQVETPDAGRPGWEYDFELAPGADPSQIHFEVRGAASLEVDSAGDLLTHTPGGGSIRWRKPASFQKSGDGTRAISTAFVVSGTRVGFSLDAWDRTEPLVIDPAFVFSTYFGGSGNEISRGIGRDSLGNIYICGSSNSGNLPTSRTVYQANYHGGSAYLEIGDAFLAKFNSSGGLSYVTYLGGSSDDIATALAVDSNGNVYLTGITASTDFPTLNGFQKYGGSGGNSFFDSGDGGDAFVAKFTSAGALVYSSYLGGSQDDAGLAIAVDGAGNAYVAGSTLSPDFPASGAYQTAFGGTSSAFINANGYVGVHTGDAFVAKISSTPQLLAATYLGGNLDDAADTIALDSSGNVWVGGNTNSGNFPVVNAFQGTFGGNSPGTLQPVAILGDGFVSELNSGLTGLLYSTFLGGSNDDMVTALAVSGGSAYITGLTVSPNFPTTTGAAYKGPTTLGPGRTAVIGDAFLAKLNPSGKTLTYSTLLGGSDNDAATALAVDSNGNAYITGVTTSANFPLAGNPMQSSFGGPGNGQGDAFLAMFDPNGKLLYSSYLGGNGQDTALGLALDSSGSVYITGSTSSANFPAFAAYQPSFSSTVPAGFNIYYAYGSSSNLAGYNGFLTVISGLVTPPPALSIAKSHSGNFTQGQSNATYTVTVSNQTGVSATSGTVTVTDTPPTGLTLVSMTGMNWTCVASTCTRSDPLAGGSSYPAITVTVNVASNAPSQVTNQVAVSGGGSATANAADPATVAPASGGHPAFFSGEDYLGSGVYYLQFPDNSLFGYYNYASSSILYHYDMGFEAFIPGSASDIYLYDFTTSHWLYTSTTLFPYLYDFTLNTWIYYFVSTTDTGHYTANPRYFSNLTTGMIFTM